MEPVIRGVAPAPRPRSPVPGRSARTLIERAAPGSAARLRPLLRRNRVHAAPAPPPGPPGLGTESARRVLRMVAAMPPGASPATVADAIAARELEPVHSGLCAMLAAERSPLDVRGGDWAGYRDAACAASGLAGGALGSILPRLRRISDAVARERLAPAVEGAPEGWDSGADMGFAAARILWGRRDLLRILAEAAAWEAGRPPFRLARFGPRDWARAARAEAARMHGDPGAWWVPEP